ncbi:MAG TPA: hypothetical protein DCM86_12935 [Verrucomicrobiales bacterium]|nr:hypothetical protein [Verrucomicrobiales bacterium]
MQTPPPTIAVRKRRSCFPSFLSPLIYLLLGALAARAEDRYDALGRLVEQGEPPARFLYDADGNRVATIRGGSQEGVVEHHLVDGLSPSGFQQRIATVGGSSRLLRYLHGHQPVAAQAGEDEAEYVLADGHGSTRMLVAGGGRVYDAFGVPLLPGILPAGHGYAGEWQEPLSGVESLRARDYAPALGRFLTPDPFEGVDSDPRTLHRYVYCRSDPVNGRDPSGRSTLGDLLTGLSVRLYLGAQGGGALATAAGAGMASLTAAAIVHDPEEFVAAMESPSAAAGILGEDLRFIAFCGRRTANFITGYATAQWRIKPVVEEILAEAGLRIRQWDEAAVVGFRGSVARGYKGPHKGNDPFDPGRFDVDAFIVSDKLAAGIPKVRGARFVTAGNHLPLATEQARIDQELRSRLPGLKKAPFSFRVFTLEEYLSKVPEGRLVGE